MASKRDDLPQPTCPTIIVSWPGRVEGKHKIMIYQITMEKYLILFIWCNFVPWGMRISILDNAGGPSGVQVKNPFVIYTKIETKDKQKPSFRAHFFSSNIRDILFSLHRNRVSLFPVQERDLQVTDFLKDCALMGRNLWTQTSFIRLLKNYWEFTRGKKVAI